MLLCSSSRSSSRSSSDGPGVGSPDASLLPSGDPEQREGSEESRPESGSRDLQEAHVGVPLEDTGLRESYRSVGARAEDSAEDATSLVGRRSGGGGRRAREREQPPTRGHKSVVSPL